MKLTMRMRRRKVEIKMGEIKLADPQRKLEVHLALTNKFEM